MMGRAPEPDDLIVPLPPATIKRRTKRLGDPYRGYNYSSRRWRELDLPMLGWRERSLYDCRTTFITLACDEDGADRDIRAPRASPRSSTGSTSTATSSRSPPTRGARPTRSITTTTRIRRSDRGGRSGDAGILREAKSTMSQVPSADAPHCVLLFRRYLVHVGC
jgi:hypothetical protein